MRSASAKSMEKALKGTESNVFYGRRSPRSEKRSRRAAFCSSRKLRKNTRSRAFCATSTRSLQKKSCLYLNFSFLIRENGRYLLKKLFPPILKALCIRMIVFYQNHLSRHTCLYEPTCSEYTKRCINNLGVLPGILLGIWRILRCNPLSKGGIDPAPENPFKKKWLL